MTEPITKPNLEYALRRVAMAETIGWPALAESWKQTVAELKAQGADERLEELRQIRSKQGKANSHRNPMFKR